ncbi:Glycerol-3-phosphate/dihydroxyacetone phosphate acyltransferase [Coemansia sp. BCRC 34962]|nr:Glycerol-3-phosphate/dihydroxyacetone phosphate acyltransferase [Coemansia sp. BCRC 34962]
MHALRRVYFLVAAASMRRRFIGFYGRCLRGIPVERQQDLAKAGSGRIRVDDRYGEPTLITGVDTRFAAEIKPGMKVTLPKGVGEAKVVEVLSDTQLRVAKEMKELAAMELLTRAEGTSFKVVPHVDQDEMYHSVYERLNNGECIGIFPEGGSHDRTEMLPLKAGATIMALGATAANPELGLKIVPTGLNYFHPSKFRSRAVIDFGQPIDIPPELVEKYRKGGAAKREACDELLRVVSEGLKQVTLNTPDYETLKMVQAGRRLYQPTQHSLTMAQQVELTRRFIKGYNVYRDLPEVKELRDRIEDYNLQLRYYGIRDHQVETMRIGRTEAGALFVWRLLWLLIMGLVALPGTVLNLPVFIVTGVVSKSKARAALAASTVKVRARDVIATWKILIALGLVPLLYTTYSILAVLFVRRAPSWAANMAAGFDDWSSSRIYLWSWALAAFMSYTALVFGEQAVDIVKSVRPLFLTLILGEEHTELLARQREELSDDITDLVNELGPKIYPEFSNTRVPADLLLGDGKKTHDNIINGSADAFHRKMREGEQALRQRMGGSSGNLRQDAEDASSSSLSASGMRQRRPSKYSFSPPTPRTMATLNSISPLEFLTSVAPPQSAPSAPSAQRPTSDSPDCEEAVVEPTNGEAKGAAPTAVARTSAGQQQQQYQGGSPATTGQTTPEPRNGMFDFS